VPGGATQLTESPLVKLVLSDLSCGVAASPLSSCSDLQEVPEKELVPSLTFKHLLAGGWMNCEVSGSYQNRRLVTWEPFLEPWRFEILMGSNLTLAAKLNPVLDKSEPLPREEEPSLPSHSSPSRPQGRLRDIGRLLRSPFRGDTIPSKVYASTVSKSSIDTDTDFCYMWLMTISSNTVSSALYPGLFPGGQPPLSVLPAKHPVVWLYQFGYPTRADSDPKELLSGPMVNCRITDAMPLNINITGALIENLSDYLMKPEQAKTRHLAPHWIRNDSGLVGSFSYALLTSSFCYKQQAIEAYTFIKYFRLSVSGKSLKRIGFQGERNPADTH